MADVTLVLRRDIPAQVLQGKGRGAVRITLDERFEQAIDRAAMKAGLSGTDDYLGEWRRETVQAEDGWMVVPDRPGLGVTLDEDFVATYRIAESGRDIEFGDTHDAAS